MFCSPFRMNMVYWIKNSVFSLSLAFHLAKRDFRWTAIQRSHLYKIQHCFVFMLLAYRAVRVVESFACDFQHDNTTQRWVLCVWLPAWQHDSALPCAASITRSPTILSPSTVALTDRQRKKIQWHWKSSMFAKDVEAHMWHVQTKGGQRRLKEHEITGETSPKGHFINILLLIFFTL